MSVIGTFLLGISGAGYFLHLNRKWQIPMEWIPALYCCGWVFVLFCAGILNLMLPMVIAGTCLGAALLVPACRKPPRLDRRSCLVALIWAAGLAYLAALLFRVPLSHYDDFSHWGLVVREMLKDDQMPNSADTLITFQAYPLGSALWIYYVCRITGIGEGGFLFAQQILQVSLLLPTLTAVHRKNLFLLPALAGYWLYALTAATSVNMLLVDSLLPVAGVALFAVSRSPSQDPRRLALLAAPLVFFLTQVKNSGIFFVLLFWLWAAWRLKKAGGGMQTYKPFLIWDVAVPCAGMLLWQRHVQLVFPQGATAKHAMTVANYAHTAGQKQLSDLSAVAKGLVEQILSPGEQTFWLVLVLCGFLAVWAVLSGSREARAAAWKQLARIWGVFLLYCLGIFAMYVFSMPTAEAAQLAGLGRYLSSCGIFLSGIQVLWLTRNPPRPGSGRRWLAAAVCAAAAAAPFWNAAGGTFRCHTGFQALLHRDALGNESRAALQSSLERYGYLFPECRCIVYQPVSDDGYLYYVLRYESGMADITIVSDLRGYTDLKQMAGEAEYLLVWSPDQAAEGLLARSGVTEPPQQGQIYNLMPLQTGEN